MNYEGGHLLRESKYTDFHDLPLTLTAQEVGEVLGISRAAAYAHVTTAAQKEAAQTIGNILTG